VKSAATQLGRIESLEGQLREATAELTERAREMNKLQDRLAESVAEASRVADLEKSLKKVQQEAGLLGTAHAAAQVELGQAIENAASRDPKSESKALQRAIAERDERVAESEALTQEKARLEGKLGRMREALDSMENESPAALKEAVQTLYEDVNDIASAWKNDLGLARDYFDEIEEGFADSQQRDATHESLRELLESLAAASLDVKDRLKAFRGLLED
jgi:chromosome segregation ATPase